MVGGPLVAVLLSWSNSDEGVGSCGHFGVQVVTDAGLLSFELRVLLLDDV